MPHNARHKNLELQSGAILLVVSCLTAPPVQTFVLSRCGLAAPSCPPLSASAGWRRALRSFGMSVAVRVAVSASVAGLTTTAAGRLLTLLSADTGCGCGDRGTIGQNAAAASQVSPSSVDSGISPSASPAVGVSIDTALRNTSFAVRGGRGVTWWLGAIVAAATDVGVLTAATVASMMPMVCCGAEAKSSISTSSGASAMAAAGCPFSKLSNPHTAAVVRRVMTAGALAMAVSTVGRYVVLDSTTRRAVYHPLNRYVDAANLATPTSSLVNEGEAQADGEDDEFSQTDPATAAAVKARRRAGLAAVAVGAFAVEFALLYSYLRRPTPSGGRSAAGLPAVVAASADALLLAAAAGARYALSF